MAGATHFREESREHRPVHRRAAAGGERPGIVSGRAERGARRCRPWHRPRHPACSTSARSTSPPASASTSLGVDTNVFYTAFDRRTDFIAHGGPGLEMVVPLHGALKLRAEGTLGYLYFARTASQRRLTGDGLGRLAYEGVRLTTGARVLLHSLLRPARVRGGPARGAGSCSRPRPTSATSIGERGSRSASAPPPPLRRRRRPGVLRRRPADQPESRHLSGRDGAVLRSHSQDLAHRRGRLPGRSVPAR